MYKADVLLFGFVLCRGKFRYGPVGHSGEILSHIHRKGNTNCMLLSGEWKTAF